ncbi:MAG: DUF192 domain-containing protein, partial [Melioribacteraceae bacterium]|nr:DUF192 domain-containing protein [Melioribacteraceae bacterium]
MAKKTTNKKNKSNKKYLNLAIAIVLISFIALIFSDMFTTNSSVSPSSNMVQKSDIYEFKKEGELSFQSASGDFISSLDIELAENDFERSEGLKYRTSMEENQGMLFIFPYEVTQSFWMRSTVLSLDMIFINSELEIVTIHQNTIPYDESSYR